MTRVLSVVAVLLATNGVAHAQSVVADAWLNNPTGGELRSSGQAAFFDASGEMSAVMMSGNLVSRHA